MLRTLLVALVAANLLFFAFARGWLDGIPGINSLGDRDPERLTLQVRPDAIRLLPMSAASAPNDTVQPPLASTPSTPPSAVTNPAR